MPSFVDTNVLVYALAGGSDSKAVVAKRLLTRLLDEGEFRTSTQVLQELFVTLTRKVRPQHTVSAAIRIVDALADSNLVVPGIVDIRDAMRLSELARISYWDALIIVTARLAECPVLYTGDLNSGQLIFGVRLANPFLPSVH